MASSDDDLYGTDSNSIESSDITDEADEMRQKNTNPRHLNSYYSTATSVPNPATDEPMMETSSREPMNTTVPENLLVAPQSNDRQEEPENAKGPDTSCGFRLGHCITIMRQLEASGYIDTNFRQKFVSWVSLKATHHEKVTVKAYINVFKDDHMDLAEQLEHTFSDRVLRNGPPANCDGAACCCKAFNKKPRH